MDETIFTEDDFKDRVLAMHPDAEGDDKLVAGIVAQATKSFEEAGGASTDFWDSYRYELDRHIDPVAEKLIYGD